MANRIRLGLRIVKRGGGGGQLTLLNWLTKKSIVVTMVTFVIFGICMDFIVIKWIFE